MANVRRDERLYQLATLALWAVLMVRAATVPFVHDECASLYWYAEPGIFLPPQAHPDANNHLLSSAIGTLVVQLFGTTVFTARLGSLLAFPLYAWCVWRLGRGLRDRTVRWCTWTALLACPFAFEFFALFRGYALELAFLAVALDGLLRWMPERSLSALTQALAGLLLANAAVLALIPLWGVVLAALGLILLCGVPQRRAQLALWMLLGLLPFLFAVRHAFDLRAQGLLYHGSTEGFVAVTVGSLCRWVLGADGWSWRAAVMLVVLVAAVVVVRRRTWATPLAVLTGLLLADALMRVGMAELLDVNHAEDRAGLHLVPLWLLVAGHGADVWSAQRPRARYAAIMLLWFPLRTLAGLNFDHTALWAEQSVPDRFLTRIAALERRLGRTPVVGAYHQLGFSVPLNGRPFGSPVPHTTDFPEGLHDVRIADGRHVEAARQGFVVEDVHEGTGLHLMRRARPLMLTPVDSLMVDPPLRPKAYFDLLSTPVGTEPRAVEVSCTLSAEGPVQDLVLAIVALDSLGRELAHEEVRPALQRPRWRGEHFTAWRVLRPVPGAVRHVLYFWNAPRRPVQFGRVQVHIHRIQP
ncbi:MAG: hypothetical protein IPM49_11355 [Flavobacteriales bacterium]|nr:hypothetical protein [Flavobacteriales bacterium]